MCHCGHIFQTQLNFRGATSSLTTKYLQKEKSEKVPKKTLLALWNWTPVRKSPIVPLFQGSVEASGPPGRDRNAPSEAGPRGPKKWPLRAFAPVPGAARHHCTTTWCRARKSRHVKQKLEMLMFLDICNNRN